MTKDELIELLRNKSFDEFNASIDCTAEDLYDLTESDLSGIELSNVNFINVDLSGSDFSESELNNVNFTNSDLTSVIFSRSTISHCNFTDAILMGTKLCSCSIEDTDFTDADLSGADFSESDASSSDFALSENMSLCNFDSCTIWPDSDKLPEDFDSEYIEDLASLSDDGDEIPADYE